MQLKKNKTMFMVYYLLISKRLIVSVSGSYRVGGSCKDDDLGNTQFIVITST